MAKEFTVSGDAHLLEPLDLFKTRLPKHLRDRALWEEEFTLDEAGETEVNEVNLTGNVDEDGDATITKFFVDEAGAPRG